MASYPVGTYSSARGQALHDRLHCGVGSLNEPIQPPKCQAIGNLLAPALGCDKTAVPQTGKVGADARLGLSGCRHQLPHRPLPFLEELEDVEPGRITQDPKESRRRDSVVRRYNSRIHIWKAGYRTPLIQRLGGIDEDPLND